MVIVNGGGNFPPDANIEISGGWVEQENRIELVFSHCVCVWVWGDEMVALLMDLFKPRQ